MSSPLKCDDTFSPGKSFVIECDHQHEIDFFWEKLGERGHYDKCGWLVDSTGVSRQVVPTILSKVMADPEKRPRVVQAFLKMQKFDIAKLETA